MLGLDPGIHQTLESCAQGEDMVAGIRTPQEITETAPVAAKSPASLNRTS